MNKLESILSWRTFIIVALIIITVAAGYLFFIYRHFSEEQNIAREHTHELAKIVISSQQHSLELARQGVNMIVASGIADSLSKVVFNNEILTGSHLSGVGVVSVKDNYANYCILPGDDADVIKSIMDAAVSSSHENDNSYFYLIGNIPYIVSTVAIPNNSTSWVVVANQLSLEKLSEALNNNSGYTMTVQIKGWQQIPQPVKNVYERDKILLKVVEDEDNRLAGYIICNSSNSDPFALYMQQQSLENINNAIIVVVAVILLMVIGLYFALMSAMKNID